MDKKVDKMDKGDEARSTEVENYTTQSGSMLMSGHYKVYPIRWAMLIAMIVLNISNGMMWLSFSPIPSVTADFYHVSLSDVDWFSQSYFVASLVIGFVAIVILDVLGLRVSMFIGVVLNLLGAILRYISAIHPVVCSSVFNDAGFTVAMIGQILTACAQPFFLYAPTKLANTWFGSNQRALCTLLASTANPIGIAAAQLISPHVATDVDKIPTLMWIYVIPAGLGTLLSVVYYRERPPTPPSASGDHKQEKFFRGLKDTVTNFSFLILLVSWGIAAGMFNALLTVIPQYLCPFGYSNQEVGLWGSLMIFSGLGGATVAGLLIDYTKKFKEIGMVSLTLATLSLIWFVEVSTIEDTPALVAVPICLIGFFGLAFLPVSMELGVEVTYPVAEATSSGLLWSAAQIFGVIFISIGQLIAVDIPVDSLSHNKCGVLSQTRSNETYCGNFNSTDVVSNDSAKPTDWTNAGLMFLVSTFTAFILFTFFFYPKYKRLAVERSEMESDQNTNNK